MATVRVFVSAGKDRTTVRGFDAWRGAWAVDVGAPAARDGANRELLRFLADRFAVAEATVRLVRGARDRLKVVDLPGVSAEEVPRRLGVRDAPR